MPQDYSVLRDNLRWNCDGDPLFIDGADHYKIDRDRLERAASALQPLHGKTIADLGSFPGFALWAFRDCSRYIGIGKSPDWYREQLTRDFGQEWLEWDFESAEEMPKPSAAIDIALLQEVIEHIRHPKRFLTRLYNWLPSGAVFYVTTNNLSYIGYILKQLAGKEIFDSAMSEDTVYPGHCTYYSLTGLADLLSVIGFQIESKSHVNFLPQARYYRRERSGAMKNLLTRSVPLRYSTHIEVVCRKP